MYGITEREKIGRYNVNNNKTTNKIKDNNKNKTSFFRARQCSKSMIY